MLRGFIGAVLLAGAFLAGCGGAQSPKTMLTESIHRYNDAVRWNKYKVAASFVPAKERETYIKRKQDIAETMRIMEYDLQEVEHNPHDSTAQVTVRYTWLELPSNIVQHTRLRQHWTFGEAQWILDKSEEVKEEAKPVPVEKRF